MMKISVQKLWGLANPTKKPGNLYPQSLNNISLIKGRPTGMCSTKSLNTQDMLSSTPVLTSCIGVIKRWEPLPQAKKQSDGWPYNIIGDQHHKGSSSARLLYKNHPCDKHLLSTSYKNCTGATAECGDCWPPWATILYSFMLPTML